MSVFARAAGVLGPQPFAHRTGRESLGARNRHRKHAPRDSFGLLGVREDAATFTHAIKRISARAETTMLGLAYSMPACLTGTLQEERVQLSTFSAVGSKGTTTSS